jgi:4-methyl-5(b-hydroxyethyl)-thiazole monophosphate biosynthesis
MKMKALVIFYPECIEFEAILAAQMLHEENLTIDVATEDGKDYCGPSGISLRATHRFDQVKPEEYGVVIIPGGDTSTVAENETLIEILKAAQAGGATCGAICAGPALLGKAGLLAGRRFTHGYGANSKLPYWEGGTYVDQLVVTDGKIVTAQPQGYIDFAVELLYAAGLRESWFTARWQANHAGAELERETEIEAVKEHYRSIWGEVNRPPTA